MLGLQIHRRGDHVDWELYKWRAGVRVQHYSELKAWTRTGSVAYRAELSEIGALEAALEDVLSRLRQSDTADD